MSSAAFSTVSHKILSDFVSMANYRGPVTSAVTVNHSKQKLSRPVFNGKCFRLYDLLLQSFY